MHAHVSDVFALWIFENGACVCAQGKAKTADDYSLVVSLLWCLYNSFPPLLLLHYAIFEERGLQVATTRTPCFLSHDALNR